MDQHHPVRTLLDRACYAVQTYREGESVMVEVKGLFSDIELARLRYSLGAVVH